MSVPQRIICGFTTHVLYFTRELTSRNSYLSIDCSRNSISSLIMPHKQQKRGSKKHRWVEKPKLNGQSTSSSAAGGFSNADTDTVTERVGSLSVTERKGQPAPSVPLTQLEGIGLGNHRPVREQKSVWKPKSYGTVSRATSVGIGKTSVDQPAVVSNETKAEFLRKPDDLFSGKLLENFNVDNSTYSLAQVRATFYPKFENEKSDHEIRARMTEMVSKDLATLEVSLKHSGSLFMYAGHEGGAYAKNSFGNIYTAVGVFVLGRMFHEAWGSQTSEKQAQFNEYLEKNRICIAMELVTAVLGDHGQRPRDDYVVVTAVTELGCGKPKFYSTPEIIAFCRKWRLPTNHVWLFSTRKSVTSFFAAFDALSEEGTATSVCEALNEVADISIPGSKDHIKVQGEILEGLVARIVSRESSKHMEEVLRDWHPPPEAADEHLGPSLREICAANRNDEKQQIKALLESVGTSFCPNYSDWFGLEASDSHSRNADRSVLSKFLQARPADSSTAKLQEMVRLMREKRYAAAFKCYHNFNKIGSMANDNLHFKMVIHVHSDSAFRRYQKELRNNPGLWPLYRGFFVDLNLFKSNKGREVDFSNGNDTGNAMDSVSVKDGLADEDANLMIKLKFLTYKIRTFLVRNGLPILFKQGEPAYKAYYLRQMQIWNTSPAKQRELIKMLDEWAIFIKRKCGNKQLSSSTYLSEAEPFLEQFAKRSPQNQVLVGAAGSLVRSEDFMAIIEQGRDEEGDLEPERDTIPPIPSRMAKEAVRKDEGLIVFFPGIPGCAKSALCKELLNTPGCLGDDRPLHSLMGDMIKGRYWAKVAEDRLKRPYSILLADKNAPNEEVWNQIENMCRRTNASAIPVICDSEGTESNPFCLDALAVFIFRVLQRVNHPGNLDKSSPNAGYVLLMFYNLYEGKSRKEFEAELIARFGSIVKMPLLEPNRSPLPQSVTSTLEEGINLYRLHSERHQRLEPSKGTYAKEWAKWEKQLRETLLGNAEFLNSIQVPFNVAVQKVLGQLKAIAKGEYTPPSPERRFTTFVFAAVSLPVPEILALLHNLGETDPIIEDFLKEKDLKSRLTKAHVTLAHKRSHGIAAVSYYGQYLNKNVPIDVTALLFSDKMAALEVDPGIVDGEKISSKNEWPHVTLWTADGVTAKEANALPHLLAQGKAIRVEIKPPVCVTGVLKFL